MRIAASLRRRLVTASAFDWPAIASSEGARGRARVPNREGVGIFPEGYYPVKLLVGLYIEGELLTPRTSPPPRTWPGPPARSLAFAGRRKRYTATAESSLRARLFELLISSLAGARASAVRPWNHSCTTTPLLNNNRHAVCSSV